MSCYDHKHFLMQTPQVKVKTLTAIDEATRVYGQVIDRSSFQTALVFLQLPDGVAAGAGNLPAVLEVYGVEDSGDAANTRILVAEKDLTGLSAWSGYMQLEIDATHFAKVLNTEADGGPEKLLYMQVAVAGPAAADYEAVVVLTNPYTQKDELLLEANVF